jgi:uncharacterized protein YkwD
MKNCNNPQPPPPNPDVFKTSCGDIEVDPKYKDNSFNQIEVKAHNEFRKKHGSKELAFDAELAR